MNTPAASPAVEERANSGEDLGAAKLRSEVLLNDANRVLKRIEARRLLAKPLWIELTVPGATVTVALVGFLGTFAATYVKGWYDLELTRQKHNADLVLHAVAPDAKQSRENLRFLLEAGLLRDPDGKLAKAIADPSLSIRLASQASADLQRDFSLSQMETLVDEIKRVSDTNVDIELRIVEGVPPNAYATVSGGSFQIIFTKGFVDEVRRKTGSNWAAYAIVAHEMAHIALNHFGKMSTSTGKQLELEAEEWSGTVLAKLGASLAEATVISLALPTGPPSADYPSPGDRQTAIAKGWRTVKEPAAARK